MTESCPSEETVFGTLSYLNSIPGWDEAQEREREREEEIHCRVAREAIERYMREFDERQNQWWKDFDEGNIEKLE